LNPDLFTFEVRGLREMGEQLAKLPDKIARRALAAAVREGASVIRARARETAPIGTKTYKNWQGRTHRPGLLRKSGVNMKKLKSRNWQTTVVFGVGFSKRGYYGRWIERGKSKKHHYTPHPFVVPAFKENVIQAVQAVREKLGQRIEVIFKEMKGVIPR
jgi:HK97 gp10 family phage protein